MVLLLMPGCTTLHPGAYASPVPEPLRRSWPTVAVLPGPASLSPTPRLEGEVGRGQGAARGAAHGAGTGAVSGLYISLATGPFAPALAPIFIPVGAVLGAAGGTALGAATAIPAQEGAAARGLLARNQTDLTRDLARRVAGRLPGLGKAEAAPGEPEPALRLEVAVETWGLEAAGGSDSVAEFFLTATYRVQGEGLGADPPAHAFTLAGSRRKFSEWSTEDGAALRAAIENALDVAAEAVTDGAFLIHDFHAYQGQWGPPTCGLLPMEPGAMLAPFHPLLAVLPRVDSRQPTLRWEAFPRKVDLDADTKGILSKVTQVRYDLRIWKSTPGGAPDGLVYERQGLPLATLTARDLPPPPRTSPEEGEQPPAGPSGPERFVVHRLDAPLDPATTYLWSIRARFLLDGEERVTRWSCHQHPYQGGASLGAKALLLLSRSPPPDQTACRSEVIPALHHHRFRTP